MHYQLEMSNINLIVDSIFHTPFLTSHPFSYFCLWSFIEILLEKAMYACCLQLSPPILLKCSHQLFFSPLHLYLLWSGSPVTSTLQACGGIS